MSYAELVQQAIREAHERAEKLPDADRYAVVNMKGYRFGNPGVWYRMYKGFGIFDKATNSFVSFDSENPYVLRTKKVMQSVIDAGNWLADTKRVSPAA